MKPINHLLALACMIIILVSACSEKKQDNSKEYKLNQPLTILASYDEGYPLTEENIDTTAPYKDKDFLEFYNDFYKDKTQPPPFDFNVDISKKSFQELRTLRAEILARHGFLFMDYVMRSHFNATNWYQPVFWYNNFKIKLNEQEKKFIDRVLKRETELYAKSYATVNGYKIANVDNVVNWQQFVDVSPKLKEQLSNHGFAINQSNYEQLFHIYDQNYYDYTPSFITTDLFLQVMHMHISKEMQALEEEKLSPLMKELLKDQYAATEKLYESTKNTAVKNTLAWNQTYYAVALSLITGEKYEVPGEWQSEYAYELEHIEAAQGEASRFLGDSLLNYEQFTPRGNYSHNDTLKKYFKCIKWLNTAAVYIDSDEGMRRSLLLGKALLSSNMALTDYKTFSNVIQFLVGYENNLSFMHLLNILEEYKTLSAEQLLSDENIKKIRKQLYLADPKKMFAKGANEPTKDFLARKKILFTAGRYTFDAEILQRLVNIERQDLKEKPKRPFPKGLDVFAAMGNSTAEQILLNTYKEQQGWKEYPDTLSALKTKFSTFNDWDANIYNKQMQTILSFQQNNPAFPYFMQQPLWQKKNINTMLASWTELKHDMLLYVEQPNGSEMGDGGDVPPPRKIAYVEPHVDFWRNCIALLELNEKLLKQNNFMTEHVQDLNNELKKVAELLLKVSEKEIKREKVSNEEFEDLSFIGGQIEYLTLRIIHSVDANMEAVKTPDRYMAIAADVYNYNGSFLEETVGMGDEIYVVAEINGLLYLTRGAVFSQYEFVESSPLTDEQWQERLLKNEYPTQPVWMNDIRIHEKTPSVAPNFNLY